MSALASACPAAGMGICLCADCARAAIERRLRERAAEALGRDPRDVCALVYRRDRADSRGWWASVSTRDGRVYVRCWATTAASAAALVVETVSG